MSYLALLRGVNVGGKNRVPMQELKHCFLEAGFTNVQTYINSGNVLFDSEMETNEQKLQAICQKKIETAFEFPVAVSVVSSETLADAIQQVPKWWGENSDYRHNALFVIHPATAAAILAAIGDINPELEKVFHCNDIIFWSSSFKSYSRTRFAKIVGTEAYKKVTVRNANTTKKLLSMSGMTDR